jgi:hypothetical protein
LVLLVGPNNWKKNKIFTYKKVFISYKRREIPENKNKIKNKKVIPTFSPYTGASLKETLNPLFLHVQCYFLVAAVSLGYIQPSEVYFGIKMIFFLLSFVFNYNII